MSSISITCLKALRACIINHPPCKRVRSCAHARQLAFDHAQKQNHVTTALHLLQLSDAFNVSSASARRRNSQPLPPAYRTSQSCAVPPLANPLGAPLSICRRKVFIFPYFAFWSHFPLLWSVTAAHFVSPRYLFRFFSFASLQHARFALQHKRCDRRRSHDSAAACPGINYIWNRISCFNRF